MADTKIMYVAACKPQVQDMLRAHMPPGCSLLAQEENDEDVRLAFLKEADILVAGAYNMTVEQLDAAQNLSFIQFQGVGWHDRIPQKGLEGRNIRLAFCDAGTPETVTEHTILLMLGVLRRVSYADAEIRQGRFHSTSLRPVLGLLYGKRIGLIGLGRIARRLMEVLKAFGASGTYYSRSNRLSAEEEAALGFTYADFDTVLSDSDIVSLHVPGTPKTRHMINAETLSKMKPSAYLINTARGMVVDEAALAQALADKTIAGAGLDVFHPEPPAADHPLWRFENVVLTPHIASSPREIQAMKVEFCMDNIGRFLRGEPVINEVDLKEQAG